MKKFFAILLGIVDVFCVGLIFYLCFPTSPHPAQIFSPHPPAHLGCFPGRRAHRPPDGPESSAEPKKKAPSFRRRNA